MRRVPILKQPLTSLARLGHRVEGPLLYIALIGIWIFPSQIFSAPDIQNIKEPDPWPQSINTDLPDYFETRKLMSEGKWEEAIIVLRSLLRKSANSQNVALDLVRALSFSGRREEALSTLEQVLSRLRGEKRQVLIRRMKVLSRLFFTHSAFQIYQDGLNLMLSKKYRAARERFDRVLEQEPDNVEVLTRMGQCLILDGDFDSAAERLRLARRLNPFEGEVRLWLGRALEQRGETREAVVELREAFRELEGSERAPIWYAEALNSLGERGAAIQVLEQDVKSDPMHVASLVTLARFKVLSSKGREKELWSARKDLQLALSRMERYHAPGFPRTESELGIDLRKPADEMKLEIDKILLQIEGRLEEVSRKNEA